MTDPVSHATAASTVAVGTAAPLYGVTISLILFWPFGIAFTAGCLALIYMNRMSIPDSIKSVLGSTLIGGGFSQLMAKPACHVLGARVPELLLWSKEPDSPLIMMAFIALVIGIFCQTVMPRLLALSGRKIDQISP